MSKKPIHAYDEVRVFVYFKFPRVVTIYNTVENLAQNDRKWLIYSVFVLRPDSTVSFHSSQDHFSIASSSVYWRKSGSDKVTNFWIVFDLGNINIKKHLKGPAEIYTDSSFGPPRGRIIKSPVQGKCKWCSEAIVSLATLRKFQHEVHLDRIWHLESFSKINKA